MRDNGDQNQITKQCLTDISSNTLRVCLRNYHESTITQEKLEPFEPTAQKHYQIHPARNIAHNNKYSLHNHTRKSNYQGAKARTAPNQKNPDDEQRYRLGKSADRKVNS
jgi:hypothetical protein